MSDEKDIIYFIAQIGHEIRTPLNAIKGFGALLSDETFGPLNPQQHKYMNKMLESSDKLLEIVNQILDWAKLESGQVVLDVQPVDLYLLVLETFSLLEDKAQQKNIALNCQVKRQTMVEGDSTRLREVLINLLSNALKFTDTNGEVIVSVTQNTEKTLLSVADTGRGISPDMQEKLFQPFSKGKDRQGDEKSTGLGLWICQSVVHLHHGRIWVKSTENVGSTFYVLLPNHYQE